VGRRGAKMEDGRKRRETNHQDTKAPRRGKTRERRQDKKAKTFPATDY
jgi:hypothetical protein